MVYQTLDLLLALGIGLAIGWIGGTEVRRRKNAELRLKELHEQLEHPASNNDPVLRQLKQQRGVINDIHKRVMAVSKGLQKQPT